MGKYRSEEKLLKMQTIAEFMQNLESKSTQQQNRVILILTRTKNYALLSNVRKPTMYQNTLLTVRLKKPKVLAMNNTQNFDMKDLDQTDLW